MAEGLHPLRSLYLYLNGKISPEELEKMKLLLYNDQLTLNEINELKSVQQLLTKLEDKGYIKSGNLDLLKVLLREIDRRPLIDLVSECEEKIRSRSQAHPDTNDQVFVSSHNYESPTSRRRHQEVDFSEPLPSGNTALAGVNAWPQQNIDGPKSGDNSKFLKPTGVIFHKGRILLCDRHNNRVCVLDKHCNLLHSLRFDGIFNKPFQPWDVAVSAENQIFITDYSNYHTVVCDENSTLIRNLSDHDVEPWAIAVMSSFLLITDHKGNRLIKYTEYGKRVGEVGGYGNSPGKFNGPFGILVNSLNQILVSDYYNHRIQVFNSELQFLFIFGSSGPQLASPYGMDADADNNVYVCEREGARVVQYTPDGTFVGSLFEGELPNEVRYIAIQTDREDRVCRMFVTERFINQLKVFTMKI